MKVIGLKIKPMDKEYSTTKMAPPTEATGKIINKRAMEFMSGAQTNILMDVGSMGIKMVTGSLSLLMAVTTKDFSQETKFMVKERITGIRNKCIRGLGSTTKNQEQEH